MKKSKIIGITIAIAVLAVIIGIWINNQNKNLVSISFYYWKSEFNLSKKDQIKLKECNSDKIYLHLFDVDFEPGKEEATPKAKIRLKDTIPEGLSIVPVIYITNRTFENANNSSNTILAKRVIALSRELTRRANTRWSEFQIDCDWTVKTKDNYFNFLNILKQELGSSIPLSATIRLHQVKYPEKTGIPPIDRGMLMFYNMGNVKTFSETNTIYDEQTSASYLDKLNTYPIQLDYALPIFSWGLHYRLKAIQSILTDMQVSEIKKSEQFRINKNIAQCLQDGFCVGQYFQKGDIVKLESVNAELCMKAAKQVSKHLNSSTFNVVFYHLGSEEIQKYEPGKLKDISAIFN